MRILIAGLGAIGQRHARNLRALRGDGVELLAYRRRGLRHVVTSSLARDDSHDVESELGVKAFDDLGIERRYVEFEPWGAPCCRRGQWWWRIQAVGGA